MAENSNENTSKEEMFVISSKIKNYIKQKSGLNTSGAIFDVISKKVKEMCDQAIENAIKDKRKTVMDRDF